MAGDPEVGRRLRVQPQRRSGPDRELGDAGRVTVQRRELQVAHVAEHRRDLRQLGRPSLCNGLGLLIEQASARVARAIEELGCVRREDLDEVGVENRPRAPAQTVDGQLDAADVVEHDRVGREPRHSCGGCDRVFAEGLRHTVAAPPLADLVEGTLHTLADADPPGDAPADLAARGVVPIPETGAVLHETLGGASSRCRREPARRFRDQGRLVVRRDRRGSCERRHE